MKRKNPTAVIREISGQLVLNDPGASALIKGIGKANCKKLLDLNADRVEYFKDRVAELKRTAADTVIILLNVDDINGGLISDIVMPGFNWQEIRDSGQIPVARGLVDRIGIQNILAKFDLEACKKLKGMNELAVVVVDEAVAEVFPA